jgi:serine protease Do
MILARRERDAVIHSNARWFGVVASVVAAATLGGAGTSAAQATGAESPAAGQIAKPRSAATTLLRDLNVSVDELTARVSKSVVQVLVTGYGPVEDGNRHGDAGIVIGRQRSLGSGAVVDADGYIITNAHVVAGAQHVQVVLHGKPTAGGPVRSLAAEVDRIVDARVVGVDRDIDLALLKIDVTGLAPIPLANYDAIRQGELVFAFGSPEGLRNSVTMGVVSSVARQRDVDNPNVYIQTDAPINPGNSGGPLVNVEGELVGLNTFIYTESGGSQGLGFAIPSAVIASVYPQLRKYGHVHRGFVGLTMQAITPALATGLGLSRLSGVLVADVAPDSPAEAAGAGVGDVITMVNGKAVESVPMLALELSRYSAGDVITLGLLTGTDARTATVALHERASPIDDLDPESSTVPKLGIIGVDVARDGAEPPPTLRVPSGVLVVARSQVSSSNDVPLQAGDVIHAVGQIAVRSMDGLRVLLDDVKSDSELVLQVERQGQLMFVTCQAY